MASSSCSDYPILHFTKVLSTVFLSHESFFLTSLYKLCQFRNMKLSQYIQDNGIKQRTAAAELDISEGYLSNLISEVHFPSARLIAKIDNWSNGAVKFADFFDEAA